MVKIILHDCQPKMPPNGSYLTSMVWGSDINNLGSRQDQGPDSYRCWIKARPKLCLILPYHTCSYWHDTTWHGHAYSSLGTPKWWKFRTTNVSLTLGHKPNRNYQLINIGAVYGEWRMGDKWKGMGSDQVGRCCTSASLRIFSIIIPLSSIRSSKSLNPNFYSSSIDTGA